MDTPVSTPLKPWDLTLQRDRGLQLMRCVRAVAPNFFSPEGECIVSRVSDVDLDKKTALPEVPFYLRERVHTVMALMTGSGEEIAWANRILDRIQLAPCDFTTMSLIELLIRHPEQVTAENRERLLPHIAREIQAVQKSHNFFSGNNDNFPSMAAFLLVVGGELLNDDHAVQAGIDNLYSVRDLLGRRGFLSEYNSPTYAGVTLHGLDETMNNTRNPEARELARIASERMWLDVAAHWHPHLSFQAGPYSRAYHNNSIAWSSLTAILVWVALGDVVFLNPTDTYFRGGDTLEARLNTLPFCQAGLGGYAGTVHQLPDYLGELFLRKTYPFRVQGTSEGGTFHVGDYRRTKSGACIHVPGRCADFAAAETIATSYLEEDFAIGTATRGFLSGSQTDIFHVLYRRNAPATGWGDIRAVFARYLINDTVPEENYSGLLEQHGAGFAIQDDRRALALYSPNGYCFEGIHSLKLALVLAEHTGPVEEIWFGDRQLPNGNGEAAEPDWVILRDGPLYLAFYPLPTSNLGRKVAMRSTQENCYRMISFYNYEGEACDWEMHTLRQVLNGFVCEVATITDYPDVPAFLADLRTAQLSDTYLLETRRTRYLRGRRELMLWLDPALQSIKAAAINGKDISHDPLRITGIDPAAVPWLSDSGPLHTDLDWWERIAQRTTIHGLEGVSGHYVGE